MQRTFWGFLTWIIEHLVKLLGRPVFSNFENTFTVKYMDLTKFTYTLSIWYKMVKFLFKAVVHKLLLASKKVD